MSEAASVNVQAFNPFAGGAGARLAVTTSPSGAAIPGLEGGREDNDRRRVLVSNGGLVSAFVRMGQANVVANTASLEILPGCAYLLTPPDAGPNAVWIFALTASGSTTINACAGFGT